MHNAHENQHDRQHVRRRWLSWTASAHTDAPRRTRTRRTGALEALSSPGALVGPRPALPHYLHCIALGRFEEEKTAWLKQPVSVLPQTKPSERTQRCYDTMLSPSEKEEENGALHEACTHAPTTQKIVNGNVPSSSIQIPCMYREYTILHNFHMIRSGCSRPGSFRL